MQVYVKLLHFSKDAKKVINGVPYFNVLFVEHGGFLGSNGGRVDTKELKLDVSSGGWQVSNFVPTHEHVNHVFPHVSLNFLSNIQHDLAKGPTIDVSAITFIGLVIMVDDVTTKSNYASSVTIGRIKKLARISDFGSIFGQGHHLSTRSRNLSANLK